jgi:hypothetical protein
VGISRLLKGTPRVVPDTPTANKIAPLVLYKSTCILFHHLIFLPCSRGKNPKAMADKGKKPIKESSAPPKKRTIRE